MASITKTQGFSIDDFLALARRVWPGEYSREWAAAALTRTMNFGAWDADRMVGSVRVLTDGYFFATIPEIVVDPAYQRRGIGRELMNGALEQAPRRKAFFGAQPQSAGFFERIGCERTLTGFVRQWPLDPKNDAPAT